MERSDKHNPRIDNAMADKASSYTTGSPVDSRVREDLRDEGNGPRPGQASAAGADQAHGAGTSEGMSELEVDRRAELATYIEGHVFPAEKQQLLDSAQQNNAPQPLINLLDKLPEGQEFEHFQEVWESVPH